MFLQHEPNSAARAISAFMEQSEFGSTSFSRVNRHSQTSVNSTCRTVRASQAAVHQWALAIWWCYRDKITRVVTSRKNQAQFYPWKLG